MEFTKFTVYDIKYHEYKYVEGYCDFGLSSEDTSEELPEGYELFLRDKETKEELVVVFHDLEYKGLKDQINKASIVNLLSLIVEYKGIDGSVEEFVEFLEENLHRDNTTSFLDYRVVVRGVGVDPYTGLLIDVDIPVKISKEES